MLRTLFALGRVPAKNLRLVFVSGTFLSFAFTLAFAL